MSQQLALKTDTGADLVPLSDTEKLIEVIARAAHDPNTDAQKIDQLMQVYERIKDRQAKVAYFSALAEMKPELPIIDRNGKIEVREKDASTGKRTGDIQQSSPYARWEDIDEAITPILHNHGFVLSFRSGTASDGKVTITGVLSHNQGHSEETTLPLPHDSTGSKNAVQAIGSSLSYGKRYTATFLLNIRTKGEDDDGEKAPGGFLDDTQVDHIFRLLKQDNADQPRFLSYLGKKIGVELKMVADIPAKHFKTAVEIINERQAKVAKAAPK